MHVPNRPGRARTIRLGAHNIGILSLCRDRLLIVVKRKKTLVIRASQYKLEHTLDSLQQMVRESFVTLET